jgi:hypothetical protein
MNVFRGDGGRNWNVSFNPSVDFKMKGAFSSSLSTNWSHNVQNSQWYGRFDDAQGAHYTFAHLDQTTTSATMRLNYTFTPNVSLQAYAQPFVSKGTYSERAALSPTPRAEALRRSVRRVRRLVGDERSGRVQLQVAAVEPRVPLGVRAGLHAVRRVEPRTPGIRRRRGTEILPGRRARPDAAAPVEHVPDQDVVLVE